MNCPNPTTVLVVDDDTAVCETYSALLGGLGCHIETAHSGEEALIRIDSGETDIVITEMGLRGISGLDLLRRIQPARSGVDVLLVTGQATITTAVAAMKLGAFDYLSKPFLPEDLLQCMERVMEHRHARIESRLLSEQLRTQGQFGGMVGKSARMQRLFRSILQVANKRQSVLITGESGTGKELAARALHELSPWRNEPFIAIDCGGLSGSLIETELFGHVRGAFTGAIQTRTGLLAKAGKGTLFFDEVGELPLDLQVKLLRVLQELQFRPVGGDQVQNVEARIVAATNVDLEAAVARGTFRKDLFYRLNVHRLMMPPLHERRSDIHLLLQCMFEKHGGTETGVPGLTTDALGVLMRYNWPGNVRELENCAQRLMVSAPGSILTVDDVPAEILEAVGTVNSDKGRSYLEELECQAVQDMLDAAGGNCAQAAKLLGVAKTTVYRKIREYGIDLTVEQRGNQDSCALAKLN